MLAAPDLPILVVEDSDEDYTALRWAFDKLGVTRPVRRCTSGDDVLAYLRRTGAHAAAREPLPALIFLDLNLGPDDGRDVLAVVKADDELRKIPVLVWTTSAHPVDVDYCYFHGANGYATKPVDVSRLLGTLRTVASYWFDYMMLPELPNPWRQSRQ